MIFLSSFSFFLCFIAAPEKVYNFSFSSIDKSWKCGRRAKNKFECLSLFLEDNGTFCTHTKDSQYFLLIRTLFNFHWTYFILQTCIFSLRLFFLSPFLRTPQFAIIRKRCARKKKESLWMIIQWNFLSNHSSRIYFNYVKWKGFSELLFPFSPSLLCSKKNPVFPFVLIFVIVFIFIFREKRKINVVKMLKYWAVFGSQLRCLWCWLVFTIKQWDQTFGWRSSREPLSILLFTNKPK